MDDQRFDALAKILAASAGSRRRLLRVLVGGTFATVLTGRGFEDATARKRCRNGRVRCRDRCCAVGEHCVNGRCRPLCPEGGTLCLDRLCCAAGKICNPVSTHCCDGVACGLSCCDRNSVANTCYTDGFEHRCCAATDEYCTGFQHCCDTARGFKCAGSSCVLI